MEAYEQRVIHNEEVFRRANERLRGDWADLGIEQNADALFLCECGDTGCREPIRIPIAEYERVRADPDAFMVVPGHENVRVEEIVDGASDSNGRFTLVHKRAEVE
jgi:hypothetical protein